MGNTCLKTSNLAWTLVVMLAACVSGAVLSACQGSGNGLPVQGAGLETAAHVRGAGSWMDPSATSGSLIYVSDQY